MNIDEKTVTGFGFEWSRFEQTSLEPDEQLRLFNRYFAMFPWGQLPLTGGVGADIGCGSGRWAVLVSPKVARLHLVDASDAALDVARRNLVALPNVEFNHASVDCLPFADNSLDFAYSLGVLHHVPDTAKAIAAIARKLKPAAPFLIYLYYSFDNRPLWYQALWRVTNHSRKVISRMPWRIRYLLSQAIAACLYWPLARSCWVLEYCGMTLPNWPLKYYSSASFYVMRTDALDRFGTRLEHRFTRDQIKEMLEAAHFTEVRFSPDPPYWCAVAIKSSS